MKGILVNPREGIKIVDFEPNLDWYYQHLECDTIDIAERKVGGEYVDIICDDEGLLKEDWLPSAVDWEGRIMLAGCLLLCKHDGEGGETGLGDELAEKILHEHSASAVYNGTPIHLLAGVEY